MIYEDFVRTLLARMGLPFLDANANAARDGVDRLVRLSAMVDDLLAEAGYDTLFFTREKNLEALRQDIKAKLKTAPPVDRETLAMELHNANKLSEKWGETSERMRDWWRVVADAALRLISAESAPGAARTSDLATALSVSVTTPWTDLMREVGRLRAALSSTCAERDTQKQMRLDIAAEQDKLVAALDEAQNQLAAERKKWPDLKVEVDHLRAKTLRLSNEMLDLDKSRAGWIVEAETLKQQSIDLRFKIARLVGLGLTLPSAEALLAGLEVRLKGLTDMALASERLREANRELADALVARKPLDRDRIRLALLDFNLGVNFINELADHLVERLK